MPFRANSRLALWGSVLEKFKNSGVELDKFISPAHAKELFGFTKTQPSLVFAAVAITY